MRQERQEKQRTAMVAGASPSASGNAPPPQQRHHAAVYFGLSCALAALRHGHAATRSTGCDLGVASRQCRWSRARELALQGKVRELEAQADELRRRRAEDARANEKVAGIFAAHEQRWFAERKSLRRQAHAVAAAARAREARHEEAAAALRRQLEDQQRAAVLRDEEAKRREEEAQEKLRAAEQAGEELRERATKDAADLRNHQAELEAELKEAMSRRDEAVATAAEVSMEAARVRREAEHKDKILSAVLRKSRMDMEDREMLVREVKAGKVRRKQAEMEAERWRKIAESSSSSRHRRGSARPGCSDRLVAAPDAIAAHDTKILFVDHVGTDGKKDRQAKELLATVECVDRYPSHVDDKPVVEEYQDLQEWFHMETERYTTMIRHRHSSELEAFTEQLRLKDEKLEAFRWRAASKDVEVARLRCRIQELEGRLSKHEQHGAGIEALLLDRESENTSLKEKLVAFQFPRALDSETSPPAEDGDDASEHCIPCSPVKIQRRDPSRESTGLSFPAQNFEDTEIRSTYARHDHAEIVELNESVLPDDHKAFDMEAMEVYHISVGSNDMPASARGSIDEDRPVIPTDQPHTSEIEEAYTEPGNVRVRTSTSGYSETTSDVADQKPSAWRVDIHALAVSYKIKRLKQQQIVLEKLAAAAEGGKEATMSNEASGSSSRQQPRSYQLMISFVSKHVKRYQSLEDKIDDLCKRMEESKRNEGRGREGDREQSAALGRFLEETFQLQRYMVATGQKLLEMQSRVATNLARSCEGGGNNGDGVDTARFMDVVGALLRDVQRGLEVRIARIIGDLEGTLTFHGILQAT
ncbi:uncharacterized protein LOC100823869 [Brachypodium distachyon]|nr:uncharacterized protein LOC100823869 [Brachypodium distachyon]|eukprot:XP_003566770.2 uncharacterized protein LOC100823869 [Brachypodium distachyon]